MNNNNISSHNLNPAFLTHTLSRLTATPILKQITHYITKQTSYPPVFNHIISLAIALTLQTETTTIIFIYYPTPTYITIKYPSPQSPHLPFKDNPIIIHCYHHDNISFQHPSLSISLLNFEIAINNNNTHIQTLNIQQIQSTLDNSTYNSNSRTITQNDKPLLRLSQLYKLSLTNQQQPPQINDNPSTQPLSIKSLNATSWAKFIQDENLSRLQILKRYMLNTMGTDKQTDIFCLQETQIKDPIDHDYHPFNDFYYQLHVPFNDQHQERGQMILIHKRLKPTILPPRFTTDGCFLPIEFTFEQQQFIIASIYLNPSNLQQHTQLTNNHINNLTQAYPNHELIFIGDYNMPYKRINDTIINQLQHVNINLQVTNHNIKERKTFFRPNQGSSSIDHAITISNQNLKYVFEVEPEKIDYILTEHSLIQLSLINQHDKPQMTPKSTVFDQLRDDTIHKQMSDIMKSHHDTITWASKQRNQRLLMDNSYSINSSHKWDELISKIDQAKTQITANITKSHEIVNSITIEFYQTLLNVIGGSKDKLITNTGIHDLSKNQIIALRNRKSNQHLSMWKHTFMQYLDAKKQRKKLSNFNGLTNNCTERVILFNMQSYKKNMFSEWKKCHQQSILDKMNKFTKSYSKRNLFEAERYLEKLTDAHAKVTNRSPTYDQIRVIDPTTGVLTDDNQSTAQAHTKSQIKYEATKSTQSIQAEFDQSTIIENATDAERDILTEVADIFYNNKPINGSGKYQTLNHKLKTAEVAQAISSIEPFSSPGPDKITASLLKLSLNTNTRNNVNETSNETEPSYLYCNQSNFKTYGKNGLISKMKNPNNRHFISSGKTPMLRAIKKLLNIIYHTGITPKIWQVTEIINIPKTTIPSSNPSDYRPIALSSNLQKILNKTLNYRLLSFINQITSNNQLGYKPNRNRSEAIISLLDYNTIINKSNNKSYSIFVDLAKAFNSIPHDKMLIALNHKLEQKDTLFCKYINNLYNNLYYVNNVNSSLSEIQQQRFGIKQGCTISSTLFIIYFDYIVENVSKFIKTKHQIGQPIDLINAYADDLVIATNDPYKLAEYTQLTIKLLKLMQLDLNEKKTQVMISKPTNNDNNDDDDTDSSKPKRPIPPRYVTITTNDGEKYKFECIDKFRYLGFHFHSKMSFNAVCADLKMSFLNHKYQSILRNQLIPIFVRKMIIQRYFLSILLSNAPVLGILISQSNTNQTKFKTQVTKPFTKTLNSMFHLPNTNPNSQLILYENLNLPQPHHFSILQAISTLVKLTLDLKNTNDFFSSTILTPNDNSPIKKMWSTMLDSIRSIKIPYCKPLTCNKNNIHFQIKWIYDALQSIPNTTLDYLKSENYPEQPKTVTTHFIRRGTPFIPQTNDIVDLLDTKYDITNLNDKQQLDLIDIRPNLQHTSTNNLYALQTINQGLPPKLINHTKSDYLNFILLGLIGEEYTNSIPTIFYSNKSTSIPIYHHKYTNKSSFEKTTTTFFIRQTALSTNLVLKLESFYPKYNWQFIHALRLCKWSGKTLVNGHLQQQMCYCNSPLNYNHLLTCDKYTKHRQIAIQSTWDIINTTKIALIINNIQSQLTKINNAIHPITDWLREKCRAKSSAIGDAAFIFKSAISNQSLTQLSFFYNNANPGLIDLCSYGFNPLYYLFLTKTNTHNAIHYTQQRTFATNKAGQEYILKLCQFVQYLDKLSLLQQYQTLPNPSSFESYLNNLYQEDNLHYLHSPPLAPENNILGTILILFLCEFLNLLTIELKPWSKAH